MTGGTVVVPAFSSHLRQQSRADGYAEPAERHAKGQTPHDTPSGRRPASTSGSVRR